MPASRQAEPGGEWLPSGFPPRSFPPGAAVTHLSAAPAVKPPRRGRGRWLAVAAGLVALLLLIGILVASRDGGGGADLAAGTSTSAVDTSAVDPSGPSPEETTSAPPPPPSIEPVSPSAPGPVSTPTAPAAIGTPTGTLEPSVSTLVLPRTDVSAGASRAMMSLRNGGTGALTFTASSSDPGLSVAPARGTIGPGASIPLTVTLDGTRVPFEGPFVGTLSFGGGAGPKGVQVQSVVGRPPEFSDDVGEACPPGSVSCSQQIKLAPTSVPDASPCNTPWLYSITIDDQSRIQSSRAIARVGIGNADAPLQRGGSTKIFQSSAFAPLPPRAVLRFAIEAVDEFGFGRRLPEQTIACP